MRFLIEKKKYGFLFYKFFFVEIQVISDFKMIRELMNKESLTGRPQSPLLSVLNGTGNIPIKEEEKCRL